MPGNQFRILILFGHPAIHKSVVNRAMLDAIQTLPGLVVHDLYQAYPDGVIDVEREQLLLESADVVVLQHPFYWYSFPSIFKEWIDLVLQYGYAYGPGGDKLKGKYWINATTAGGPAAAYHKDGYNRFTIRQLLAPVEQTAFLCGMKFLPPFVAHGSLRMDRKTQLPIVCRAYSNLIRKLQENPELLLQTNIPENLADFFINS
jgi:glutathione-regulated potassium-efflux system ancillary protein KefG